MTGTPSALGSRRIPPFVRVVFGVVAIGLAITIGGSLRQLELGRTALERSRVALGIGDYRTAIEEAELAAASYVPMGRYHREGFDRLMLIADDALGRADDETANLALTSAKSALRTSPMAGAARSGVPGSDWSAAIEQRTSKLRSKTPELPKSRTPIVVAEEPPPLRAYAWLGLAALAYLGGVGVALRRGGERPLSMAGLAMGLAALFVGIALYSL